MANYTTILTTLNAERKKLDVAISALTNLETLSFPRTKNRRRMSEDAKRRISEAQKKRWARVRKLKKAA